MKILRIFNHQTNSLYEEPELKSCYKNGPICSLLFELELNPINDYSDFYAIYYSSFNSHKIKIKCISGCRPPNPQPHTAHLSEFKNLPMKRDHLVFNRWNPRRSHTFRSMSMSNCFLFAFIQHRSKQNLQFPNQSQPHHRILSLFRIDCGGRSPNPTEPETS